jgi:hypothetical protein
MPELQPIIETRAHLQIRPLREVADEISRFGWVVQA